MPKLTPHDKAILVGLHMSGGSCEGPSTLHTLDLMLTARWFETVLEEMRTRVPKKELKEFCKRLDSIFMKDEIDPRYPIEYVEKLSPLAIATWLATNATRYTQAAWSAAENVMF